MGRIWQRLAGTWRWHNRSLGTWNTTLSFVATGLDRATGGRCRLVRYIVVAQPIPSRPLLPSRRGGSIHVRRLRPGDSTLDSFPRRPETYASRFAQGAIAYGAFRNGEPIGFIWFTLGVYDEDEVHCAFHPVPENHAAWDFDVYVAPRHRFTSAFAHLWDAAGDHMRQAGVRWTMSRISAFNVQSIAAHRRLGATERGTLNFLCIGPLQLSLGNLSPRLRVSWGERGKPMFRVDPGHSSMVDSCW